MPIIQLMRNEPTKYHEILSRVDINPANTVYIMQAPTFATDVEHAQFWMTRNGNVRNLRLYVHSNSLDVATTFSIVKNVATTTVLGTISAGSTTTISVPLSISIVDGDKISFKIVTPAGTGAIRLGALYFEVS